MSETAPWYVEVAMPPLMASARNAYVSRIQQRLRDTGFYDIPRGGVRAIGTIARQGRNLTNVAEELQISKQGASQLIDQLVLRGYLVRIPDEVDRRRVSFGLTERGELASLEIRAAIEEVEAELLERVSGAELLTTRKVLGLLHLIGEDHAPATSGTG
jgi:DNA-binding MarR family transcriptional regulator